MKPVPLGYRILLIGMLPLIAGVLYFKGQRYDPALIEFKAAVSAGKEEAASSLEGVQDRPSSASSEEITGFRQFGQPRRYTRENLYEHVDGHAEYFIGAGFQRLTVTEYAAEAPGASGPEIQAEVFDMGKSIQAFGVLADESGENPVRADVGTMGFKTSNGVNFIKGRYYVKISAFSPKAPVMKFAKGLAEGIHAGRDSFEVFSMFPALGRVENTRFIKEGYRGLDFLHDVVERTYSSDRGNIAVALMTGSEEEMKSLRTAFFDYFKKSGIVHEKVGKAGTEAYKVMDRYEGNWFLIPSARSIFAVFGTEDEGVLKYFGKEKG